MKNQHNYKILFYLEPWLEDAYRKENYRLNYFNHFIKNITKNLQHSFEIYALISDFHYNNLSDAYCCKFYTIEQEKLTTIFNSHKSYTSYDKDCEKSYIKYLNSINLPKDIDLIYSVSSNLHYINKIYDKVPKLFLESGAINGYISNIKSLYYLDPNLYNNGDNFLNLEYDNLVQTKISKCEKNKINNLKKAMKPKSNALITKLRAKYNKIYLLSIENLDSYFSNIYFQEIDVFSYIVNIVSHIPKDSIVIITEHKRYRFMTKELIDRLNNLSLNFIFDDSVRSNQVIPYVDGVIAVFSTILLNAIILEKPIFVASEKSYLFKYSDAKNISSFIDFIKAGKSPNKNKMSAMSFLINKYYINEELLLNCNNYLIQIIQYYKKNETIDFNFYNTLDQVFNLEKYKFVKIKTIIKKIIKKICLTFNDYIKI